MTSSTHKATTIKLEGDLLQGLEKAKPESLSLSAFVKELLMNELHRRQLAEASQEYTRHLSAHESEVDWLEEWENAPLHTPVPSRRPGKSKK